ncbi:uncharacterized protein LOC113335861 [Papaver somniferum]|uniref:uncharacterized protein LOC113335861 n=1 Tax=Papaver somniferum TaxID=3469 RepID=UPI000E6FB547|nr:uncharacterized protein LOC113335861 [Papaver somniferum]
MGDQKKLITICQSGGEFVKNKDGSLSYINGEDAHAVDIDNETKFDDFKLELAGMWNYSPETVTIKYILAGHGKTLITIFNDRDLKRMVKFHENSTTADVFVIHQDVCNMPAASSTTISEAVVPVDDTPVDGISAEPDPVFHVPFESISPNQPPAIAVTAAKHHRAVERENTVTGVDQMFRNVYQIIDTLPNCSKKKWGRVEGGAARRRSTALILMKQNDYVGARKKLIEARTAYPGLDYIDELIKVCDIVCAAEDQLQGSGIDWYSVLQTNKTASESDIEFQYTELIRTLEPIKNKFPEIQSSLGLIEKAYNVLSDKEKRYEFDWKRAGSLGPSGSVKPLDVAHSDTVNMNREATSQCASGNKRVVSISSDKSNPMCNSLEQPLKKVRSLGGDDCEIVAET